MTSTIAPTGRRTPWHLWLVGIVALLFEGFGCYQYLMTELDAERYIRASASGMGWTAGQADTYIRFLSNYPMWATAVWAIGVWGGLLAAILLLLRIRLAVLAFAVSLVAFVINTIYTLGFAGAPDFVRSEIVPYAVIFVGCALLLVYAWAMRRRGVLR